MGAIDVLTILEKAKKELTSKEISELIDIGEVSVRRILRSLNNDISVKLEKRELTAIEKRSKFNHPVNVRVTVYKLKQK